MHLYAKMTALTASVIVMLGTLLNQRMLSPTHRCVSRSGPAVAGRGVTSRERPGGRVNGERGEEGEEGMLERTGGGCDEMGNKINTNAMLRF